MNNMPSFSIVVATKGRVKLLIELLESIYIAREQYKGICEAIIVDDSSQEEQDTIIAACERLACRYEFFESTVSKKRNYGVSLASNEIILFLDSDCRCTPNILNAYAASYEKNEIAAAGGPLEFTGDKTWFWGAIEVSPYLTCFYLPKYLERIEWGVTANFTVKKKVFEKVGGFDARFTKAAGEDVDLGLMIRKAGYEICGVADALVFHSIDTWIPKGAMYKRVRNYGAADYSLIRKHPERADIVLPKRTMLYLLYTAMLCLSAFIVKSWIPIATIPALIGIENFATAIMVNCTSDEKKSTLFQQLMTQTLIHTSEISYSWECIKHFDIRNIRRQMIYYEGQYRGIMTIGTINNLISHFCFALILIEAIVIVFL